MVKKISEAPEGIRILAVLYFASALILMFVGSFIFNIADSVKNVDPMVLAAAGVSIPNSRTIILAGLLFVAVSILYYFLAKGLLNAKNWTRIVIGVMVSLGVVSGIIYMVKGAYIGSSFGILVNALIIWYLFFKDTTKKFFK